MRAEQEDLEARLAAALRAGEPADGDAAVALAEEHRLGIDSWFYDCPHEMHRGLGQMYVDDERFAAHYDERQPGWPSGCTRRSRPTRLAAPDSRNTRGGAEVTDVACAVTAPRTAHPGCSRGRSSPWSEVEQVEQRPALAWRRQDRAARLGHGEHLRDGVGHVRSKQIAC
jgi:hypothetical protein